MKEGKVNEEEEERNTKRGRQVEIRRKKRQRGRNERREEGEQKVNSNIDESTASPRGLDGFRRRKLPESTVIFTGANTIQTNTFKKQKAATPGATGFTANQRPSVCECESVCVWPRHWTTHVTERLMQAAEPY